MTAMAPQSPFQLLGCDFSSSPTRRKPIVLALGQRLRARVVLTALQPFDTLAAFGQWLVQPGDWVGGFDLPFGLPRELVQALGEAHAQEFEVACEVPKLGVRTLGRGPSRRRRRVGSDPHRGGAISRR